MLRKINIHGFKGVMDATLELGRLTAIVGPVGSGKTSCLEAVAMLGCAAQGQVDLGMLMLRGVRIGAPARYPTALAVESDGSRPITLEVSSDWASYHVNLTMPAEDDRARWGFAKETFHEDTRHVVDRSGRTAEIRNPSGEVLLSPKLDSDHGIASLIKGLRGDSQSAALVRELEKLMIFSLDTPVQAGTLKDPWPSSPMGPQGGGRTQAIERIRRSGVMARFEKEVSQAIVWLDSVAVEASPQAEPTLRFQDRQMAPGVGKLSAGELSEGALYVTALLTLLFDPATPPLLIVDNVDHALNPKLASYLFGRLQEIVLSDPQRPQLLLTSRHPYVLEKLDLTDERVRLYYASRDRLSGVARLTPVKDACIQEGQPGPDMPRARLWLSGGLAGVPSP